MIMAIEVALLGGVGAALRYLADLGISSRLGRSLPWGTMLVNITGSGLAGVVVGATTYQTVSPTSATLLLVGFLGGFTTASTIAFEVVRLFEQRRPASAVGVCVGTLATAVAAGVAGLAIGAAAV